MKEHLELGITERFGKLVQKTREGRISVPRDEAVKHKDGVIEAALKMATNRVILARNVGELSQQLQEVATDLVSGKDPAQIDGLRAAVMLKVGEIVDSKELESAQTHVDDLIKSGDVAGAVAWLRKMSTTNDEYRVGPKKQKEVDDLLDAIVELDNEKSTVVNIIEAKTGVVFDKSVELSKSVEKETTEMSNTNTKIESEVARKFVEGEVTKVAPKPTPDGKVNRKAPEVKKIVKQVETAITGEKKAVEEDKKFLKRILNDSKNDGYGSVDVAGNLTIEVDKFKYIGAKIMYARASIVLGRNKVELSKPENTELREYLEKMQFELRERLMEIEGENKEKKTAKSLIPGEVEWEDLDPKVQETIIHNADFINKYPDAESLLKHAQEERKGKGLSATKTEAMIRNLIAESNGKFIEGRDFRFEGGEVFWEGDATDFFELIRREIYKIKDSVPEENLGQLMFVDQAQLYLALLGVSAKGMPEIRQAKDAVTKMLYMEFALKSLWKAGGNHEAWQRAGGLLLRDEPGTNFFMTMKIRERFRGKVGGKDVELPGFNVNDIMTMGELDAPNGQSWLAYISTDNMALNETRLKEYVQALAKMTYEKARLTKGGLKAGDLDSKNHLDKGEITFDQEQMDWIRNYTHYMHTATMNAGEKLWLMDAMKPGDKGFDYASIPGGQFAEKSGLWGVLYFAKYSVTKYGYEALGKLFVPNHGLLSFARGETFRHFFSDKGNEAWLAYDESIPDSGKGGARDFFFKGVDIGKDKMGAFTSFWEEVWLDRRTGTGQKTKGMRAIKHARDVGRELIIKGKHSELISGQKVEFIGKHKDFIAEMDFSQLEKKLGHDIPGTTNEEKLLWTVDNLSYEMLEIGTMPSKREADWLNKYSKNMTETDVALQAFLDAPTLANKMKILESVAKYNSAALKDMSKMLSDFMEDNRKVGFGKSEDGKQNRIGPTVVKTDIKEVVKDGDGGNMVMPSYVESMTDGWYPGRGLFLTRQAYKEGTNDPMFMRKLEIKNAIAWGIVDAKEGGQMMRDWQKMIYFGDGFNINVGGRKVVLRPGMIPFLTPYFLMRGWWVDKMGLDWADFKLILSKQNEETFAKLMKLLGVSG